MSDALRLARCAGLALLLAAAPPVAAAPPTEVSPDGAAGPGGAGPSEALRDPARPLEASEAVDLVLARDPLHAAARAARDRAGASLAATRARFVPLLSAGIDYTRTTTTSLAQSGVLLGDADLATARAGLSWQLPQGTALSAELGLRVEQRAFVSPLLNAPLRIGPGYGVTLRVGAVQPLLRGLGETIGRLPEANAAVALDATTRAALRTASERVREALAAFAELWLAERTVTLRAAACAVARQARDEAQVRVEAGDLAPPEALPLVAELANAEEARTGAEADRLQRQLALARLLGVPFEGAQALSVAALPPLGEAPLSAESLVAAARENAVTLAERDAAVASAALGLTAARDRLRPRLDASAWVEASGLGDKDPLAALGMWGTLGATSAYVSLSGELPSDRTQLLREVEAAEHATREAVALRDAERLRIEAEARAIAARWEAAIHRATFARTTADAARAAAEAFAARRDAGAVTTLVWLQMTREAQAAALRVDALKVEALTAALAAYHAAGRLLEATASP
jgi:outer membrane protein TolC